MNDNCQRRILIVTAFGKILRRQNITRITHMFHSMCVLSYFDIGWCFRFTIKRINIQLPRCKLSSSDHYGKRITIILHECFIKNNNANLNFDFNALSPSKLGLISINHNWNAIGKLYCFDSFHGCQTTTNCYDISYHVQNFCWLLISYWIRGKWNFNQSMTVLGTFY